MEAAENVLVEKEKLERLYQKIKELEQNLSEKETSKEKSLPPTTPTESEEGEENKKSQEPSTPSTTSVPATTTFVMKKKKKKRKTRTQEVTIPGPGIRRKKERKITLEEIKRKLRPPGLSEGRAQTKESRARKLAKSWITL